MKWITTWKLEAGTYRSAGFFTSKEEHLKFTPWRYFLIRMQNAINSDHRSVLNPSAEPFVNLDDMVSRLLPFHVLQNPVQLDTPALLQLPDFSERMFFNPLFEVKAEEWDPTRRRCYSKANRQYSLSVCPAQRDGNEGQSQLWKKNRRRNPCSASAEEGVIVICCTVDNRKLVSIQIPFFVLIALFC
jgi:hypothetical protein